MPDSHEAALTPDAVTPRPGEVVGLEIDLDRKINFAAQQNDIPPIRWIRIENRSPDLLRDVELSIRPDPGFCETWSCRIAAIAGQSSHKLTEIDLRLSPRYLASLTEGLQGSLALEVQSGGTVLGRHVEPIHLLARDEWSGLSSLPELMAAFVLPNNPAVASVLRSAAEILRSWGEDGSLNGYQSQQPIRVHRMVAAIYAAIQKLGIAYANPPASFEETGQRIRLPEQVDKERLATCLDLALLAAACIEQAGLHALVVLVEGHAFTGCWLEEDCFPVASMEDGLNLRKRVDVKEILVFDPTLATSVPSVDFPRAVEEGRRHLQDLDRFRAAIDIARARKGRIRPIPDMKVSDLVSETAARQGGTGPVAAAAPPPSDPDLELRERSRDEQAVEGETPTARLERWKRKLLDLSLRNRLLNFKESKKTVPLLCPDLATFEDRLATGSAFKILPRPQDLGPDDPRDPRAHRRRTGQEGLEGLLREELDAGRVRVDLQSDEMARRLTEIYRTARVELEEGGASALYLAIGFLHWYESEKSERMLRAPLLLVPVEVQRSSARQDFSLRQTDEDPRFNVTLLEMLKQDHGLVIDGLDPLPSDDAGIDVKGVLHKVRKAVRDVDRWEVQEDVRIGFFSFAKFLMWRDLSERKEALLKNKTVDFLVNRPDRPFDADLRFPDPARLDEDRAPEQTFCPLPTDSSQLAAIFAAAGGRTFVLEGPPGTGKSQTITNLIAQCLAEGKTVLFVSEKMAALNVVHRRLEKIGLGRFCLELHSNKARKAEVLRQLEEGMKQLLALTPPQWSVTARRVAELRNTLNAYVRALHIQRSIGESVFQVRARLIGLRGYPLVKLPLSSPDRYDADALRRLRERVDEMATIVDECGNPSGHPLSPVRKEVWSPIWQDEVAEALAELGEATESMRRVAEACGKPLGVSTAGACLGDLEQLRNVQTKLLDSPVPPSSLLTKPKWDEIEKEIVGWIESGRHRDVTRAKVREQYEDSIISLDLDWMHATFDRAMKSVWPLSWWRLRPVKGLLASVAIDRRRPRTEDIRDVLARATELRRRQQELDLAADNARALLGELWNGGEAEWDSLDRMRVWSGELRDLAGKVAKSDGDKAAALLTTWARLVEQSGTQLSADATGRTFGEFGSALDRFVAARSRVEGLLELDGTDDAWKPDGSDVIGRTSRLVHHWQENQSGLRSWCAWRRSRTEAAKWSLMPLVSELEAKRIEAKDMRSVFERSFGHWWLSAVVSQEPVLRDFISRQHEERIKDFRQHDDQYMSLTEKLILARLAERVPDPHISSSPRSEMGVLRHQLGLKRRHMPIRRLLKEIRNVLPRIKPCFLMSPISVAQYLDPDYPPFDLIVFDEASQITVWDAVGALGRGRQAVIVGDPKQLPPTNFFDRVTEESEDWDNDAIEDLESILDECIASQIPSLSLDWHYRSRHESLIHFSNHQYYSNRLLTFPSPLLEGMGVSWRHVPEGVYDKGKSRTNRAEAEAVVAEIRRRLTTGGSDGPSIGVVTFSQAQQTLIEDLLDEERRKNPDLERHFSDEVFEPVFVKNLENVQGDERDIMFFSVCYGPDLHGRVAMNFGPLNRDGGHRRLNVAITRARRELLVFSTLRADQIDLARTRARGVRDLQVFLDFAKRGSVAIAEATRFDPEADFESPFEEAVYEALVREGCTVHKQVGCASYRIDLAVIDPDRPGRYLLGIECDGANYHRAKTARDRDKLREAVLRDLGWDLYRIWSTDWWEDPRRETEKVLWALRAAKENAAERERRGGAGDGHGGPGSEKPAIRSSVETVTGTDGSPKPKPFAAAPPTTRPEAPEVASTATRGLVPTAYLEARITPVRSGKDSFLEPRTAGQIKDRIAEVVRVEGPISFDLLAKRVSAAWEIERVGKRIEARVHSLLSAAKVVLVQNERGAFVWPEGTKPGSYQGLRVPDADGTGFRRPEDLPVEEIANGVRYILEAHVAVLEADLLREVARLFGFQRTGSNVEERMRLGVTSLMRKRLVRRDGDRIVLAEGRSE